MPDAPALLIRNLAKAYGDVAAVLDVSLSISAGEIVGLLGPNGAGKTTTIECVLGLRQPDQGSIEVFGLDALRQSGQVKQLIGAALQSTALQDKITPREALNLFGAFYKSRTPVETLLARFGLLEKADAAFDTLSGGQRQRVALALAMVNNPRLVVLDEPTAGLDPHARRELHQEIRLLKSAGHTVLLCTHHIDEAQLLCDRVAILHRGRVVTVGKPDELIAASKANPNMTARTSRPLNQNEVTSLAGVLDVELRGDGCVIVTTSLSRTVMEMMKLLESREIELLDLSITRPSLEDVFLELTGARIDSGSSEEK